jgi:hypothetical protein
MRRGRTRVNTNEILILSGVTELALGALTGWPYALAVADREKVRKLGIRSVPRLRQWHLDLIALGALTILIGTAVPNLPRRIAWPLAVGAWANANAFGVLAFNPPADTHRAYRAAAGTSFATVSWGCASLAVLVARRMRAPR